MKQKLLQSIAKWLAERPGWMIIGAILYLVSPIDIIPEALVGPIGYIDDIAVLILPMVIREYVKRLKTRPDVIDTTIEP